jgi:hypothetical protein
MPRGERLATPSSCKISDLLASILHFVEDHPDWADDEDAIKKVGMAYHILSQISDPRDVSKEEEDFIMRIFYTMKERSP